MTTTVPEGVRTQLARVAATIRSRLARLAPDEVAYALLVRDGENWPWTAEAERAWTALPADGDPWRPHHLAVLNHARAYDLEAEGSPEAFRYWEQALFWWAYVHDDNAFWERLVENVGEAMGAPVAAETVSAVRGRLPSNLLAPHLTLAARHCSTDPDRARRHVELIRSCPLPAKAIAVAREGFAADILAGVPAAIEEARFEEELAELSKWLYLDPGNESLVHAVLRVHRSALEHLGQTSDRSPEIHRRLEQVGSLVEPLWPGVLDATQCLADPEWLRGEVARFACWAAVGAQEKAQQLWESATAAGAGRSQSREQIRELAAETLRHYRRACELDPALAFDGYYRGTSRSRLTAAKQLAVTAPEPGSPGAAVAVRETAQELRDALADSPDEIDGRLLLANLLIDHHEVEAAGEVGELLDAAEHLTRRRGNDPDGSGAGQFGQAVAHLRDRLPGLRWSTLTATPADIARFLSEGGTAQALAEIARRRPELLDELARGHRAVPAQQDVLWALLVVFNELTKPLWAKPPSDPALADRVLAMDRVVGPAVAVARQLAQPRMRSAIARYDYWVGVAHLHRAVQPSRPGAADTLTNATSAAESLDRAAELDPGLLTDSFYHDVRQLSAQALCLGGQAALVGDTVSGQPSPARARQLLRGSLALDDSPNAMVHLAMALAVDQASSATDLTESDLLLRQALASAPGDTEVQQLTATVRGFLQMRRKK